MKRKEALDAIKELVGDAFVVTTAGGATVEWHAVRPSDGNLQAKTLGLCSSIGLGLALGQPDRKVIVLDGDGALWMNLSSLGTIGWKQPRNLVHICMDNTVYESSGGTPTVSSARMNFAALARAAGIESAVEASTPEAFAAAVAHALGSDGPHFIWCRIEQGRANVPPFPYDELENKYRFIRFVEETTGKRIIQPPIPHSYEGTLRRAAESGSSA
ncbi:MAG TPA: thiamine pyrophosphate-dependent enzyme [Chloroflexota bacterium]|nr:thiamine pyrophosphate-dependent enzyme [Chloroflexota bacterium]